MGKYQLDLACGPGAFIGIDQSGVHGNDVAWDTLRWNDNGPLQFLGQIMIPNDLSQTKIVIHGDEQFVITRWRNVFKGANGRSCMSHNGACYPVETRMISPVFGIKMYRVGIQ